MNNSDFERLYWIYNRHILNKFDYVNTRTLVEFQNELRGLWVSKGNKVKTFSTEKFPKKYPEVYAEIHQKYILKVRNRLNTFNARQTKLLDYLVNNVDSVEFTPLPELRFISSTFSNDYRSTNQGAKYALVALKVDAVRLVKSGFQVVIKEFFETYEQVKYELWANIPNYQVMAAIMRNTTTEAEKIAFFWANGVNPYVYNPYFKHDLVEPFNTGDVYNPPIPLERYKV